jgi:6-phosphogluconolactonase
MEKLIDLRVVADLAEMARAAAEEVTSAAVEAVRQHGRFAIALSGGSTPRPLFRLLASTGKPFRARLPWDRAHFFWGDERHVPPDHPDSNYRMAREELLDHVPVPAGNVHRIRSEDPDAGAAANDYEQELRRFFAPPASLPTEAPLPAEEPPRFDLMLLGIGPDGHTASLFPGTSVVHETQRWVAAPWVEALRTFRITLTPPVLNAAARVLFLVSGADKAAALRAIVERDAGERQEVDRYPAQVVQPARGSLLWLVDRDATGLLSHAARS